MVSHRIRTGAVVLGLFAGVFATDRLMAELGPPPVFPPPGSGNMCCFPQPCPDGSGGFNTVTACVSGCAENEACDGGGTCVNGVPTDVWAACVAAN